MSAACRHAYASTVQSTPAIAAPVPQCYITPNTIDVDNATTHGTEHATRHTSPGNPTAANQAITAC